MAQNPHPFGSAKYDEWQYQHPEAANGTDQLLADSKGTLARSGNFLRDITPEAEQAPAAEPNGFLNEQGSVFDSPMDRLVRLGRQIVRPIPGAIEGAAGVGAFLPGPVGLGSRVVTGLKSGADLLFGGMEGLQEHPIRSALDVGGVAAGASSLKGLKALSGSAPSIEELANLVGGRALAYEGGAGARPAARPAISAIQRLMKSPSFENLPQGKVGMSGRAPRVASPLPPGGYHAQDLLDNPDAEAYMMEQFARNKPIADMVFGGKNPKMVEANLTPALEDLATRYGRKPLNPLDRLAARSAERFGKRFRKE